MPDSNEYIALDVETANADFSSICQIGLALFRDGKVIDTLCSYIDPEMEFDTVNTLIHGIDESTVAGSPTWQEFYPRLVSLLSLAHVVHHTGFDKASITQACARYNLPLGMVHWVDSARAARRSIEEVRIRGYGLVPVAHRLGIPFDEADHHDALKDAIVAGQIMYKLIQKTGMPIQDWPKHLSHKPPSEVRLEGNPDGPLSGERIVFTGALKITRLEAAKIAAEAGCDVDTDVNKHTTLLVVGDQDFTVRLRNSSGKVKPFEYLQRRIS